MWSSALVQQALNLLNSTIWGVSLEFLNFVVFYKLALVLTNFENHRTVDEHENNMITKMCACACVMRIHRTSYHPPDKKV